MKPRCTEKTEMETFAMPEPLVSIIVPAYNAAGCIARCVESIVSQSYQELEILLLNDGSKDDTLAICRKLAEADPRIRVIDKPNTGAADTRSCGLALARGEYIQFADSDDYLLPGCTANLVAAARRSRADLVLRQLLHDAGILPPGKIFHALALQPAAQGRIRAAYRNVKDHPTFPSLPH